MPLPLRFLSSESFYNTLDCRGENDVCGKFKKKIAERTDDNDEINKTLSA